MATKSFQFDYKKYESKGITVKDLDDTWAVLKDPSTSKFVYLAKGIFLLFAALYFWLRFKKIEEQMLIEKQEYESSRSNSNAGQLGNDNLD